MNRTFKIHCSQIGKIMGKVGLTEAQEKYINELEARTKPMTDKMKKDYEELIEKRDNPKLPDTCTTHLKEWYADDREQIHSKYMDKGNMVEDEVIDMMADVLGFGLAYKNDQLAEDEYMIGTCDVNLASAIVDVKSAWNNKTLHDYCFGMDKGYEWQGRGYMRLYNKEKFIVFHGLVNTPADANYDIEVSFDHIPIEQRWVAYEIDRNLKLEQEIIDRVIWCREWLDEYDRQVQSRLGRVNKP